MPTHKKDFPRIMKKRRRCEKRKKILKKGGNPDDFFNNGVYVGKEKAMQTAQ